MQHLKNSYTDVISKIPSHRQAGSSQAVWSVESWAWAQGLCWRPGHAPWHRSRPQRGQDSPPGMERWGNPNNTEGVPFSKILKWQTQASRLPGTANCDNIETCLCIPESQEKAQEDATSHLNKMAFVKKKKKRPRNGMGGHLASTEKAQLHNLFGKELARYP